MKRKSDMEEFTFTGSRNLRKARYNEVDEILYIEFLNGTEYAYYNVPPSIYRALIDASSPGSYHANNIKTNYRYDRIR